MNMSMYGVGEGGMVMREEGTTDSTVNGFPFGTKQDFFGHPSLTTQWAKLTIFESSQNYVFSTL